MNCDKGKYYGTQHHYREPEPGEPILREFHCRKCGVLVRVADKSDKRRVFCCPQHERSYWRHDYARKNDTGNGRESQGMSGGMSLGSLIRREKRDLD